MIKIIGRVLIPAIIFLSVAYLLYWKIFIIPEHKKITITSLHGKAERLNKGQWTTALIGDQLSLDDGIRTGPAAEVVLDLFDDSKVIIADESQLSIREVTTAVTRLRLQQGKISAAVTPSKKRQFEIDTADHGVLVSTQEGAFTMTSSESGVVAVATKSGEVKVSAKNKNVVLSKGKQTHVLPNQAPKMAELIPTSVFLKIDWPSNRRLNVNKIKVAGTTTAGARVRIMGKQVKVDSHGKFSVPDISLQEGNNIILIESEDAAGNIQSTSSPAIIVDTKAPDINLKGKDLWQ